MPTRHLRMTAWLGRYLAGASLIAALAVLSAPREHGLGSQRVHGLQSMAGLHDIIVTAAVDPDDLMPDAIHPPPG